MDLKINSSLCKHLKKVLSLSMACMIFLSSCQKEANKIGFLLPHLQSDRYQKEKVYFSERILELGGEVIFASAEYDDQLQIRQAKDMIAQGAKVLVINPVNFNTAAEIIRQAHKHGIKVIAYDRIIRNCDLDLYLSFNSVEVGSMMASYVLDLKPEGKIIILGGDKSDQNAVWVKEGILKILDPAVKSGKIKIVYDSYVEGWAGANAAFEIKRYLNLSSMDIPDAIIASSDGISAGVVEALSEYHLSGKVLLTGQDANLTACQNIVAGKQSMSVYKPFKKLAYKAAETAFRIARGEAVTDTTKTIFNGETDVKTILFSPVKVDKDNLKQTVIDEGFHTQKDIYGLK